MMDKRFFKIHQVRAMMMELKDKKCYGYKNIPVKIIRDGVDFLAPVFCKLLNLIYDQKVIPEKWRTARIIPFVKKGNR
jgi:hypothetical protein